VANDSAKRDYTKHALFGRLRRRTRRASLVVAQVPFGDLMSHPVFGGDFEARVCLAGGRSLGSWHMRGSIQRSCWTAGRVWCSSLGVLSRMSRGTSGSRARRFANMSGRPKQMRAGARRLEQPGARGDQIRLTSRRRRADVRAPAALRSRVSSHVARASACLPHDAAGVHRCSARAAAVVPACAAHQARAGWVGIWEITFAPDGRATFEYGEELVEGEAHVIWRRVGGHGVLAEP